jgi:hypothetical protein
MTKGSIPSVFLIPLCKDYKLTVSKNIDSNSDSENLLTSVSDDDNTTCTVAATVADCVGSPLERFGRHKLFDRNVLGIIKQYHGNTGMCVCVCVCVCVYVCVSASLSI